MTLVELIDRIKSVAMKSELVNFADSGSSIYTLNSLTIHDYAVVYVVPDGQHTVTDRTTTYHITLFYLDRLVSDLSNETAVYSTALQVLSNIVRGLSEVNGILDVSDSVTMQNFVDTEGGKLADIVGGAYASFDVTTANMTRCFID